MGMAFDEILILQSCLYFGQILAHPCSKFAEIETCCSPINTLPMTVQFFLIWSRDHCQSLSRKMISNTRFPSTCKAYGDLSGSVDKTLVRLSIKGPWVRNMVRNQLWRFFPPFFPLLFKFSHHDQLNQSQTDHLIRPKDELNF